MLCTNDDEFVGAVSGGCVESDISRVADEVLNDGVPRLVHYGSVRDSLLDVGLNCDGQIDVLVEPVDRRWLDNATRPFLGVVTTTCTPRASSPGATAGGSACLPETSGAVVPVTVKRSHTPMTPEDTGAPRSVRESTHIMLVEPVLPPPLLLMFGAGPVADNLARLAAVMDFTTVISDPRESRFGPQIVADHLCVSWPEETFRTLTALGLHFIPSRTYVVSLEHEPHFEDALWDALLDVMSPKTPPSTIFPTAGTTAGNTPSRRPVYIGAIGKAQRAIERNDRARESGRDLTPLQPIRTPIGLDIGGKSAPEIALSILAQIVATVHRRPGGNIGGLQPASIKVPTPT